MKATVKMYDTYEMEWKSVEVLKNEICITQDEHQPWYYFASFVKEEMRYYNTINAYFLTDIKSLQQFLDTHFKEFFSYEYFRELEGSFRIRDGFKTILSVEKFLRQKEYDTLRQSKK